MKDVSALKEELLALGLITGERLRPLRVIEAMGLAMPPNTDEMPQALAGQNPNLVAKDANDEKVWILDFDLLRKKTSKSKAESFVLRVSGAVVAEDTERDSLAKVNRLFLDRNRWFAVQVTDLGIVVVMRMLEVLRTVRVVVTFGRSPRVQPRSPAIQLRRGAQRVFLNGRPRVVVEVVVQF